MDSRNIYDRVFTIFGTVMVFFYLGLGLFILLSPLINLDKPLRIIFAIPLFIYAIYRAMMSYNKIRESFFESDEE